MHLTALRSTFFFLAMFYSAHGITQTSPMPYEQGLERIGGILGEKLARTSQRAATVLDFTNLENMPTHLGRLVAQDLTDKLVQRVPGMNWIDRAQRDFVVSENRLAADKLLDPATRKQLGKLIGVDTIVVGTVIPLGKSFRMQARAIEIETARVIAVDSVTVNLPDSMVGLADRTVIGSSAPDNASTSSSSANRAYGNRIISLRPRGLNYGPFLAGRRATATLEIENISGRDIWIGIASFEIGPCIQGDHINDGTNGIRKLTSNSLYTLKNGSESDRRSILTELPAGGRLVVIAEPRECYSSADPAFAGRSVPVSITFGMDYERKFQVFTTSIADFPITKNLR